MPGKLTQQELDAKLKADLARLGASADTPLVPTRTPGVAESTLPGNVVPRNALEAQRIAVSQQEPYDPQRRMSQLLAREPGITNLPINYLKGMALLGEGGVQGIGMLARWLPHAATPQGAAEAGQFGKELVEGSVQGVREFAQNPYKHLTQYPFEDVPVLGVAGRLAARGVATGAQAAGQASVAAGARSLAERGVVRGTSGALFDVARRRFPALDEMAKDQAMRVAITDAKQASEQAVFFAGRNEAADRIAAAVKPLAQEERQSLILAAHGVADPPLGATPEYQNALNVLREMSEQDTGELVARGLIRPETARNRAFQPLRVERFGIEQEQKLQRMRASGDVEKAARAEAVLTSRSDALAAELSAAGKAAPFYMPFLKTPPKFGEVFPHGGRNAPKLASLKQSSGGRYASGDYMTDPLYVGIRSRSQVLKLKEFEEWSQKVMADERVPKRVWDGKTPPGPDEVLWSPHGTRAMMGLGEKFDADFLAALDATGSFDDAIAEALRANLQGIHATADDIAALAAGRASGKPVYVIPSKVARQMQRQVAPVPGWVRTWIDRPTDYWRIATLAARPAWLANNLIGNMVFGTLNGVLPMDYARALSRKYAAKMPAELGVPGMTAEASRMMNLGHAADSVLGRFYQWAEATPAARVLAWVPDQLRVTNEAIEQFGRRANYLAEVRRSTATNQLKATAEGFWGTARILDELDNAAPETVERAIRVTNDFMGNYSKMGYVQRQLFRRFVPFIGFMRHQAGLMSRMPIDYPGRTLLLDRFATTSKEMMEDDEVMRRLPQSMRDRGLVWSGQTKKLKDYGDREFHVFVSTTGVNPLNLGYMGGEVAPPATMEGEGGGGSGEFLSETIERTASQMHPAARRLFEFGTRRDAGLGQPFTRPGVIPMDGRFYDAESGREVAPPVPPAWTLATWPVTSSPPFSLAKSMIEPRANWTAAPLETRPSKSPERSLTAQTRETNLLRYFTPASITYIDLATGETIPAERVIRGRLKTRAFRRAVNRQQELLNSGRAPQEAKP